MNKHAAVIIAFVSFFGLLIYSCASGGAFPSGGSYKESAASPSLAKPAPAPDAAPAEGASSAAQADSPLAEETAPASPQDRTEGGLKPTVRYLSADDSNSAASPVIVRKLIRRGRYVDPSVIRTYEFLNYYHFDYPAPLERDILIIPQMRVKENGAVSLQIALRSKNVEESERKPFNITFLVDNSGSMAGRPSLLIRQFLLRFMDKLREGDIISIVAFNRTPEVLLDSHKAGMESRSTLQKDVIPRLVPNDVTDIEKGLTAAFALAQRNYGFKYLNRVVVLSDGAANAGETAAEVIGKYAEDSDKQGIYLAGIGLGEGFDDSLMNTLTDKGRGAYLFIDTEEEIDRMLAPPVFMANFDLALKNVRLKMVMPPGWKIAEFHGEQISEKASEVIPQYLSPNDQMIYHMVLTPPGNVRSLGGDTFEFEAEYTPLQSGPKTASYKASTANMIANQKQALKGDAIVEFAEMLKKIEYPLEEYVLSNKETFDAAYKTIAAINASLKDPDLNEIIALCGLYGSIITAGEQFPGSLDKYGDSIPAALGIPSDTLIKTEIMGNEGGRALKTMTRLGYSTRIKPMEGYRFISLSSGPVESMERAGNSPISPYAYRDPQPDFSGGKELPPKRQSVYDLTQIVLTLKAPSYARSFSFDFNFFSAEYPEFVQQNYNDTFYAILQAASTNNGAPTNISFDANGNSIEVDNNYFQNPFHPIPNTGTGFDAHGSTGWLKTSWPIQGGEEFTLTFSIHDEGDGIYDSMVLLDNFTWNAYPAVGTTDPLN